MKNTKNAKNKNAVKQEMPAEPGCQDFPEDFVFGVATSAWQVEGARDQRGASIWDSHDRDTGGEAAMHIRHWQEDVRHIAGLGVDAYRFSVSWPRVMPDGRGAVQYGQGGMDFYDRLVDALLENNIAPWVTLYHWDLPTALQDAGGWCHPDIVPRFLDYGHAVTEALGDRVRHWMIVNEPSVIALLGHGLGQMAPHLQGVRPYVSCTHNLNRVIAACYRQMKAQNSLWQIGSTYTCMPFRPEGPDTQPAAVTRMAALWQDAYLAPLLHGRYPDALADLFDSALPNDSRMEFPQKTRLDFYGLQYYAPLYVANARKDGSDIFGTGFGNIPHGSQTMMPMGYAIEAGGLGEALDSFKKNYGEYPLVITENGYSRVERDEIVTSAESETESETRLQDDSDRISYLQSHLSETSAALRRGVNLKGYFVWSLLDNVEWHHGTSARYGLIHVDYRNGCRRTPKKSWHWFKDFLSQRKEYLRRQVPGRG